MVTSLRLGAAFVLVALGAQGCADPPDANACGNIQEVSCDGGTLDDTGAWMSSAWTGPHVSYPAFTTLRVCHGLGRVPTSVEVWASFVPDGLLAQQIGNVGSVLPSCDGTPGVTDRYVLLRNGGGQDFFARFVLR